MSARVLKMTLLMGVPFGLVMGLLFSLLWADWRGLPVGACMGLAFGLLLSGFAERQRARFTREAAARDDGPVTRQGPANHFKGWESVGGWLELNEHALTFRSHGVNFRDHEWSVPLGEVLGVEACSTAGVVPNGLRVVTPGGVEQFVVEGRREWVRAVRRAAGLDASG